MSLHLKYFVLAPEGTEPYAVASRAALKRFAACIQYDDKKLADELNEWLDDITGVLEWERRHNTVRVKKKKKEEEESSV